MPKITLKFTGKDFQYYNVTDKLAIKRYRDALKEAIEHELISNDKDMILRYLYKEFKDFRVSCRSRKVDDDTKNEIIRLSKLEWKVDALSDKFLVSKATVRRILIQEFQGIDNYAFSKDDPMMTELSEAIKKYIKDNNLTEKKLAEKVGSGERQIRAWIAKENRISEPYLEKLNEVMGTSIGKDPNLKKGKLF